MDERLQNLASFNLKSVGIDFAEPIIEQIEIEGKMQNRIIPRRIPDFIHEYLHYFNFFNTRFFWKVFAHICMQLLNLAIF